MPIVLKCGNLNLLEPSGPVQACNGIAFTADFNTKKSAFSPHSIYALHALLSHYIPILVNLMEPHCSLCGSNQIFITQINLRIQYWYPKIHVALYIYYTTLPKINFKFSFSPKRSPFNAIKLSSCCCLPNTKFSPNAQPLSSAAHFQDSSSHRLTFFT